MKRELVCPECRKFWAGMIGKYPGEEVKIVDGVSIGDFFCDGCSKFIAVGDPASAVSLYTKQCPYKKREELYIKPS